MAAKKIKKRTTKPLKTDTTRMTYYKNKIKPTSQASLIHKNRIF